MDRGINIIELLHFGVDAFGIFSSIFGIAIGVVFILSLVKMFRDEFARKRLLMELNQEQKFRESQPETAEEKEIRRNAEIQRGERIQINRKKNISLIVGEHSEQKLNVKALIKHVLHTHDLSIRNLRQLSWSMGYAYCIFYFQRNIQDLLETNINDDEVDWKEEIQGFLIIARFSPQLWIEDARCFIEDNLRGSLENQLIQEIIELAKSNDPKSPFGEGFDAGTEFLMYTSLPRFDAGFKTSIESFWEHFSLDEIDFIGEFQEQQKWFREY